MEKMRPTTSSVNSAIANFPVIWLTGLPGSGKTTIYCYIDIHNDPMGTYPLLRPLMDIKPLSAPIREYPFNGH